MAKKFTRRRWRRPERMVLDHAPVERRKDLGASEAVPVETELAQRTSHRRRLVLLLAWPVLCALEGYIVGSVVWKQQFAAGLFVVYGAAYFAAARAFGVEWIVRAVGAHTEAQARIVRLASGECQTAGVPVPRVLACAGDVPNAIAFGREDTVIITTYGLGTADELVAEAVLAHEVIHLRDAEAELASLYVVLAGAPDVVLRGGGLTALLSVPLWPVALVLRAARALVLPSDREHRADIAAAMLTRYPPGLAEALRSSGGESSGLRVTDALWFVRRDNKKADDAERRARLVEEM